MNWRAESVSPTSDLYAATAYKTRGLLRQICGGVMKVAAAVTIPSNATVIVRRVFIIRRLSDIKTDGNSLRYQRSENFSGGQAAGTKYCNGFRAA